MSQKELIKFKKDLSFYKYDKKLDVGKKIREIKSRKGPPL
jgi:hypothetical protein